MVATERDPKTNFAPPVEFENTDMNIESRANRKVAEYRAPMIDDNE